MRIRFFLALASVSTAAIGFVVQACGGDSDTSTPVTAEAGPDVRQEASVVDAPAEKPDAADCDPNKDFLSDIPDASIADGASTTGLCLECTKTKCSAQVTACAADCTCQSVAGNALECFAKTHDPVTCAGSLISVPAATQKVGIALFTCVNSSCNAACAASTFTDGGDGG